MKTIMVHGAYGHSKENWFPWLKESLEGLGYTVVAPDFPTPEGQSLENWRHVLTALQVPLDGQTILVGHSVGVAFLLDVLERAKQPVKAAFFVSGFVGSLGDPRFDSLNRTFTQRPFDWKKIRAHCPRFVVFHADNDPYVPLEKAEELAKRLGVEVTLVKGAGHFNERAGYQRFDRLLDRLKEEL
jgi:predicted alpha/beta hydrolase family esterase